MKIIKTFIIELPRGVKFIILINSAIYFVCVILSVFSIDLFKALSFHSFVDTNFRLYQLVTSVFVHSFNIDHILVNSIFFLVFAPGIERKIKTRNFIALYLISGISSVIVAEYFLHQKYIDYNELIKICNRSNSPFKELEISSVTSDLNTNYILGSSGAIFGVLMYYFLDNFLILKKIGYVLFLSIFFIMAIITVITNLNPTSKISESAHLGGSISGAIYFFAYKASSLSRHVFLNKMQT